MRKVLFFIVILSLFFAGYYFYNTKQKSSVQKSTEVFEFDSKKEEEKVTKENNKKDDFVYEVVAENLNIPWELAFLPSGDILVTERPGTLRKIGNGEKIKIKGVVHKGEGGLLGMALHPNFSENNFIYFYLTSKIDGKLINRVERYKLNGNILSDRKVILDNIPGAIYHDGGRIKFGPDGYLYITVGDARMPKSAQDINSLAGKILRIKDDGGVPEDNPFSNFVYSYGHRNPQGITWDDKGQLWSTEHGRSGILSGYDELNLIKKGKNYGWPDIQGDEKKPGMEAPILHSGPDVTWAPASAVFLNGSIFFGGLRGESLYEAKIKDNKVVYFKSHFKGKFGRIRNVSLGPDGYLYITTSNTDGRGDPKKGDDKIIKINPKKLF